MQLALECADIQVSSGHVRFSNRLFGVKHFQTVRRCGVDAAHGLALCFGIGAKALPSRDSRRSGAIFAATLPSDGRQVQANMRTHLIHRPASDIDTAAADSLKVLDPKQPIREADMAGRHLDVRAL